jgi:anti-sigma regulatory factor (Ser/Thr protein kinase)
VTLSTTKLKVDIGPRSVGLVRRWVADACIDIGRADLVDCARLGVSELVTNALLHGAPPITVAVRGTVEHPRIEVSDGSPRPPASPVDRGGMATTGRGLSIVAKCSIAWGAEISPGHKIVWFEPASEVRPHIEPPYSLNVSDTPTTTITPSDALAVSILGADAQTCYSLLKHYRDLRRELRMLALTHSEDYPLAHRLAELIIDFEREFPQSALAQLEQALNNGEETLDIKVDMSLGLPPLIPQILEVLDLADAFCRAQQFLAIARTTDENAYCHWFLEEFSRQARGEAPQLWIDSEHRQSAS